MEKLKGIVRAATDPKEWQGKMQIGFTLEDDPKKWYNISGEEKELKKIKDTLIKKGNEIEFNIDDEGTGEISDLKVTAEAKESEGKWEDDIVNFETLLNVAHKKQVHFSIKTRCLNVDIEKKYALFKASVEVISNKGTEIFQGHGDATADNVKGTHIKPHFIRMAETRAIVRALRWYTNNAQCSEEEKSDNSQKKAK